MKSSPATLLTVFLLSMSVLTVNSLKCFTCVSGASSHFCGYPFDRSQAGHTLTECADGVRNCIKTVATIQGQQTVTRACGVAGVNSIAKCDGEPTQLMICYCKGLGCNSASHLAGGFVWLVLPVITAIFNY